jgi:predicted nucleic acid-binding protein
VRDTVSAGRAKARACPGVSDCGRASAFVDTTIWVYAHLKAPGDARHERALALVQADVDLITARQVVVEYYNVMGLSDCRGGAASSLHGTRC